MELKMREDINTKQDVIDLGAASELTQGDPQDFVTEESGEYNFKD
jgi:hypothetical protein